MDDPLNLMRVMPTQGGQPAILRTALLTGSTNDKAFRKSNGECLFCHSYSDRINKMDKMKSETLNGSNSENSIHSVEKSDSDRINKMDKMGSESGTSNSVDSVNSVEKSLPNSRKVYVSGKIHPEIRVPFREISLAPTKTMSGEIEINEPVRVYDTSGPWGDNRIPLRR